MSVGSASVAALHGYCQPARAVVQAQASRRIQEVREAVRSDLTTPGRRNQAGQLAQEQPLMPQLS